MGRGIDTGEQLDFHALRHTFGTNIKHESLATRMALGGWKTSSMADRYSHPTLHNDKVALVRSIPDYTLASKQSQEQRKTGTDDSRTFLHNSCLPSAPIQSNTESSGKKNLDSVQKTALCVNNEGAQRMFNPLTTFSYN